MKMQWSMIMPFFVYLVLMLLIGYWANKTIRTVRKTKEGELISEYYLARRSLGPWVLAFTLMATFASAGAFIGAPGQGYSRGFFVVIIGMAASGLTFLVLGGVGKKLAIVSRKIGAVTFPDVLRARFDHPAVGIVSAILIVVFLVAYMTAQIIGGARIFETLTGFPYVWGVILTGLITVIYSVIGGYRAVVWTDLVQGILMIITPVAVVLGFLYFIGFENVSQRLMAVNPKLLTPNVGGAMSFSVIITLTWLALGVAVIGSPQLVVRGMSYRDSRTMHQAVMIGTFFYTILALLVCFAGVFAILVVGPNVKPGDLGFPSAIVKVFYPFIAGIFLSGAFAAIMSTVDSILLVAAAGIVEDVYVKYINPNIQMKKRLLINQIAVMAIGLFVFIVALFPAPPFLYYIIWWYAGGFATAFIFPLLAGLYWPRANKYGALAGMIGGSLTYFIVDFFKIGTKITHAILPGMVACFVLLVVVSLLTGDPSKQELERFWGE